jgi:hypothetical protein
MKTRYMLTWQRERDGKAESALPVKRLGLCKIESTVRCQLNQHAMTVAHTMIFKLNTSLFFNVLSYVSKYFS